MSRWAQNFFGLPPAEGQEYILEELFQIVEHCGISYDEARMMPVVVRKWWLRRKNKEIEEQNKKGGSNNTHTDPHGKVHR